MTKIIMWAMLVGMAIVPSVSMALESGGGGWFTPPIETHCDSDGQGGW